MKYIEYGEKNNPVIVLLHGGGLSWWHYRQAAENLKSDYHVVLPVLDGHAGAERDFTTIEDNAEEIIRWIDEQFDGSVELIGGCSLGAQILVEMLSMRDNICQVAVIESALVMPSKLTASLIRPSLAGCYGLVKMRWFAKLQFQYLRIPNELFEDYFRDTCMISMENMIRLLESNLSYSLKESLSECKAKVLVFVGKRESRAMRKSAELIHSSLSGSTLEVLSEMHHGELSMKYVDLYSKKLTEALKDIRFNMKVM